MIVERAPGKLYIAGEYAVVEPGEPAVLVALDRYITVEVTASREAGTITSAQYGQLEVVWRRVDGGIVVDSDHRPYDFVLAAIKTVEQLVIELGLSGRFYDLSISSELDDASGRKFGLGSSAAVTVATVRALNTFYELGLGDMEIFKTALIASVRVSTAMSGGDVAASSFGGWIAYSAPDRAAVVEQWRAHGVRATINADWEGLRVERLPAPSGLTLVVGWTGQPASTAKLVGSVQRRKWSGQGHYREFLERSRACVTRLIDGFHDQDAEAIMRSLTDARGLLRDLAQNAGMTIETADLTALCDSAEAIGAAAKSSGAGGGDCGIVLARNSTDLANMLTVWEQHDIRRLSLSVHPAPGQRGKHCEVVGA